ncbi:hypothetical protein [Gayadomonas joobiniege]|uniref:hypothetical protein n=1 Tax=Gayadomonas joobiniege TaxID=1234606 RepID=UPI0003777D74|nr:hypothetical protein [Gayadomonas joobiniege]
MNIAKVIILFKFYVVLDLPFLMKELFVRGGALVLFMMSFEFISALVGEHGIETAMDWALAIMWPTIKVSFLVIVALTLVVRGISKRKFLVLNPLVEGANLKDHYKSWEESELSGK